MLALFERFGGVMAIELDPRIDPKVISAGPEAAGGEPIFPGTQVTVGMLRDYLMEGRSIDDFLDSHDTVTPDQVLDVLYLVFERTIGPTDH